MRSAARAEPTAGSFVGRSRPNGPLLRRRSFAPVVSSVDVDASQRPSHGAARWRPRPVRLCGPRGGSRRAAGVPRAHGVGRAGHRRALCGISRPPRLGLAPVGAAAHRPGLSGCARRARLGRGDPVPDVDGAVSGRALEGAPARTARAHDDGGRRGGHRRVPRVHPRLGRAARWGDGLRPRTA